MFMTLSSLIVCREQISLESWPGDCCGPLHPFIWPHFLSNNCSIKASTAQKIFRKIYFPVELLKFCETPHDPTPSPWKLTGYRVKHSIQGWAGVIGASWPESPVTSVLWHRHHTTLALWLLSDLIKDEGCGWRDTEKQSRAHDSSSDVTSWRSEERR